ETASRMASTLVAYLPGRLERAFRCGGIAHGHCRLSASEVLFQCSRGYHTARDPALRSDRPVLRPPYAPGALSPATGYCHRCVSAAALSRALPRATTLKPRNQRTKPPLWPCTARPPE